jgi:hypothetical protein
LRFNEPPNAVLKNTTREFSRCEHLGEIHEKIPVEPTHHTTERYKTEWDLMRHIRLALFGGKARGSPENLLRSAI